ncbi:MAG: hypothetical protein GY830_09545 [Bacteroidetes bacterium]|nr:hypothetical protein [Bacteroidota bacterium]
MNNVKFFKYLYIGMFSIFFIKCNLKDKKGMLSIDNSSTIIMNSSAMEEKDEKIDTSYRVSDAGKWVINELNHNKIATLDEDLLTLIENDNLNQNEIDAFACFYSRIGKKLLSKSDVLEHINNGSKYLCAEAFTHFRNKKKSRDLGFIKSGFIEMCMFLNTRFDADSLEIFKKYNIDYKIANENLEYIKNKGSEKDIKDINEVYQKYVIKLVDFNNNK